MASTQRRGTIRSTSGGPDSARIADTTIRRSNNSDYVVTTVQNLPGQPGSVYLSSRVRELSNNVPTGVTGDVDLSGMHVVDSPSAPSVVTSKPDRVTLPSQASARTRMVYDAENGVLLDRQTGSRIIASETVASLLSQRPDSLPIIVAARESAASTLLSGSSPASVAAGESLMNKVSSEPDAEYATSEMAMRSTTNRPTLFGTRNPIPVSTSFVEDIGDVLSDQVAGLTDIAGRLSSGIRGTVETTGNVIEKTPGAIISSVLSGGKSHIKRLHNTTLLNNFMYN